MAGQPPRRQRQAFYAALDYMRDAEVALREATDRLHDAECNAAYAEDERLTQEARVLRRAVEAEEATVGVVIGRAQRR